MASAATRSVLRPQGALLPRLYPLMHGDRHWHTLLVSFVPSWLNPHDASH